MLQRNDVCTGEYISESVWASRKDFDNWRESQKFAQAHGGGEEKEKKVCRSTHISLDIVQRCACRHSGYAVDF